MKHILHNVTILCISALALFLTNCEKLEIPVIKDCTVLEIEPTIIEASAVMTSKQIDECGIAWSKGKSQVSPSVNDGSLTGTLDSEGKLTISVALQANTDYYFIFWATNEVGTTTSETIKVHTSFLGPKKEDNPLPEV